MLRLKGILPGVGWGTLIFSYIRRLEPFLGVQNFELQYLFWVSLI